MKTLFKALRYGFSLYPPYLFYVFFNDLSYATLPFVSLYFGGKILDLLLAGASYETVMKEAWILITLTALLSLIKGVTDALLNASDYLLNSRMKKALMEKSLSLSLEKLEDQDIKTMLEKAREGENGFGSFASFLSQSLSGILKAVLGIVYAGILFSGAFVTSAETKEGALYAFLNHPYSFLVILGLIFLVLVGSALFMSHLNKIVYDLYDANIKVNREGMYIMDVIADYRYAKDIRIYGMKDMILSLIAKENDEVNAHFDSFSKKQGAINVLVGLINALVLFASYLYVGAKAYYGIITVGAIVSLVGAVSSFSSSLFDGLSAFVNTAMQLKYLRNFFAYLEIPEKEEKEKEFIPSAEATITFDHVCFRYPNSKEYALEDVSFSITPKKRLAIVGPNGAGKSTIIKLIARFYHPEKGTIRINGEDIEDFTFDSYQRELGILFQDFSLFGFTLKENVAGTSAGIDEKRVGRSLSLAGFGEENLKKLPHGTDTYLFHYLEDGAELSGGEQQKAAIARALYKDSPVILLDEPTSALDPLSELHVYESIDELVKEKTSVFISHRMSSTKFCDRILVLDHGHIVQEGTHEELMKSPDLLYARMFSEQAKYYR
jgi:ATP-binding cassette subfamily B protein